MQTLAEFVARNSGHRLDFDGIWPGQCVDLARCYLRDCFGLGYEPPPMPGADDWFQRRADGVAAGQQIIWTANKVGDASQHPQPGDLVIWGADPRVGTGSYGHIDIWLSGDGLRFHGFDQNWPLRSSAHVQLHDYRGVLGWGRPVRGRPAAAAPPVAPQPSPTPPPTVPPSPQPPAQPLPSPPVDTAPESIAPPPVPEPTGLVERGISTSEWKLALGYLAQGAAMVTLELVNLATGTIWHLSVNVPPQLLQVLVDLEFAGAGIVASYVLGRSIRKVAARS